MKKNPSAQKNVSIKKQLKSFLYAFHGLKTLIRDEHNSRIHLVTALIVVALSFFYQISAYEWIAICFAIGIVFITELLNSAIENLSDFISPQKHDLIKKTKDLSAAAVLVSAIIALVIGVIIFLPKIIAHV